jgi:hypothetical protein
MLIREIILAESYYDDLISAVQDLLAKHMAKGIKTIKTEIFKNLLQKQGYTTTMSELIQAVDQSGFSVTVNSNMIVPKGELPAKLTNNRTANVDISNIASKQATKDIKAKL